MLKYAIRLYLLAGSVWKDHAATCQTASLLALVRNEPLCRAVAL